MARACRRFLRMARGVMLIWARLRRRTRRMRMMARRIGRIRIRRNSELSE
jgi:hypothetical protein